MMKKVMLILCCMLSQMALAKLVDSDNVELPSGSTVQLLEVDSKNGAYRFRGQIKLKGLLTAGWVAKYDMDGQRVKDLELHFYPQSDQVAFLPALKQDDYENAKSRLIIVNRLNKENKQFVQVFFNHIPSNFFKYEEGVIKQPAIVILDEYTTYVECDSRYYEAKLVSIEKLLKNDLPLVKKSGCSTQYAIDVYTTYAKDGFVNLRTEPKKCSKVVMQLANDKLLEKIYTSDNWFYVQLFEKPEVKGYVHKSQVVEIDY
ncbi:hypothetical protein [Neisseria sp. Ec49-e6-T10]|uniref:hypothetical protein n=1 Tax=Neisseria sp. Ec49-e6-T10 TaxID=3140744 RepID=UPI003EC09805